MQWTALPPNGIAIGLLFAFGNPGNIFANWFWVNESSVKNPEVRQDWSWS